MKYPAYSQYKDSDVEWLGEVPEHWIVTRLGFVTDKIGDGLHSTPKYIDTSDYHFINGNNLDKGLIVIKNTTKCVSKDEFTKYRIKLNNRTILLSINGTIGKIAFYQNEKVILGKSAAYIICNDKFLRTYLFYFVQSTAIKRFFINEVTGTGTTIPNLSLNSIKNTPVLSPPIATQQTIANFLDRETTKIDDLISKQQKLISLLQEKRQAVISHAVTKGLNPDAKMKDSGVEWLGDIPEDWNYTKLKFSTSQIVDGAHFTPTYVQEGVPFLRVTDIQQKKIDLEKVKYIPKYEHSELIKRCKPKRGDVLLSKNGTIGLTKVVNWDWEFSIFVSLCCIKLIKEKLTSEFLMYAFHSKEVAEQIAGTSKKTSVTNLHLDKIRELVFALPPIDVQITIASFLDRETIKIDHLISKANKAITLMQERRTALISAAVTGKIDVRNA